MKRKILIGILTFFLAGFQVQAQEWLSDIAEAKKVALEQNRPILLVFQGSDWCAPCMKLERKIWDSQVFKDYAKEHYVLLRADFPRKRKNQLPKDQQEKNNLLAEKYNTQGFFPFVALLNSQGEVLGKTGYEKISPEEYIKLLNSFE
jgi:thioredoxin-related protein